MGLLLLWYKPLSVQGSPGSHSVTCGDWSKTEWERGKALLREPKLIPLPRIWLYPGRQRQLSGSQHSRKAFYIVYLLGFILASVPPSDLSSMFNSLPLSRELLREPPIPSLVGSALPPLLVLTTFSTLQRALRQHLPACRMARAPWQGPRQVRFWGKT